MFHVRQENLPFVGSSHEFVGAEQGNTGVSVFLFHGKPGSGPGPHRHPYDEIQFIREGRGVWTVSGKTFEGSAGDIFVIKAGEIHSFKAVGDSPLVQFDVHLSPRFIKRTCRAVACRGTPAHGLVTWRNIAITLRHMESYSLFMFAVSPGCALRLFCGALTDFVAELRNLLGEVGTSFFPSGGCD